MGNLTMGADPHTGAWWGSANVAVGGVGGKKCGGVARVPRKACTDYGNFWMNTKQGYGR